MALTQNERAQLIGSLVENGWDEDLVAELTDNQLVALDQPENLDELVDNAYMAMQDDEDDEDLTDNAEDDDMDDDDMEDKSKVPPQFKKKKKTGNMGKDSCAKTLNEYGDDELEAEMMRRKKKKKTTTNARDCGCDDGAEKLSVNQYVDKLVAEGAPEEVVELITNAQQQQEQERSELIELITANESNMFTEAELKNSKLDTLRRLARLAQSGIKRSGYGRSDYTANAGGGTSFGMGSTEEPLDVPDLEWGVSSD